MPPKQAQLSTPSKFGVIVLDRLPILLPSALLRLETRPFLPGDSHPFREICDCRSPRSQEFHHILAFAILKAEFVAASCMLASRLVDQIK